jgi:hypothetical protein
MLNLYLLLNKIRNITLHYFFTFSFLFTIQFILTILSLSLICYSSFSQDSLNNFNSNIYSRELQLLDKDKNNNGLLFFTVSPFFISDSFSANRKYRILTRILSDNQYNTSRPYGWNNGSFIKAKGFQTRLSPGISLGSKYIEVGLQPEFVYAVNDNYKFSNFFGSKTTGIYTKIFPGQSYLQFKFKNLAFTASTQNIWWGPGIFNSLLFSDNAPGFPHLRFHTNKPFKTKLGFFEWQVLVGKLKDSKELGSESFHLKPINFINRWRYLNAVIFTWNPKWVKGLVVGFTRSSQVYGNGLSSLNLPFFDKYLPVIASFTKNKLNTQTDAPGGNDGKDQQATFMFRYTLPNSKFELYAEYGFADFKDNLRDLAIDAQHGGAIIVGIKKLFVIKENQYFSLNTELTHTSKTSHFITRNSNPWYQHWIYLQGFSNYNQILGAGSGLGNNMQTLHFEKIKGANRIGLKIQKIQNDPSAFFTNFNNLWLSARRWTDFTLGPTFHFSHKRLTLKGDLQAVYGLNYAWLPDNLFNLYFNSSLIYHWR